MIELLFTWYVMQTLTVEVWAMLKSQEPTRTEIDLSVNCITL